MPSLQKLRKMKQDIVRRAITGTGNSNQPKIIKRGTITYTPKGTISNRPIRRRPPTNPKPSPQTSSVPPTSLDIGQKIGTKNSQTLNYDYQNSYYIMNLDNLIYFTLISGGILYLSAKHYHCKTNNDKITKRNILISNTNLSDSINNKNSGKELIRNNPSQIYPSSSRLRYNRKRYLV